MAHRPAHRFFAVTLSWILYLGCISAGQAAQFTGEQTAPDVWTYTLTFDALDNYSICQDVTTITLGGLTGVTEARPPQSTSFPSGPLDEANRNWDAEILDGGSTVRWSNSAGTGNFSDVRQVFGFRVVAPGAQNGRVTVSTDGFERDGNCPSQDLDFTTVVDGPVAGSNEPSDEDPRWQIPLRTRTLSPPAGLASDLVSRVEGVLETKAATGALERVHLWIQLAVNPTEIQREEWADGGVHLLQSLGRTHWIGSVDRRGLLRLESMPDVRWVDLIDPYDKMAPGLIDAEPLPYQQRGAQVAYSVLFHGDVDYAEARRLVQGLGGTFESVDQGTFGLFRGGIIVLPPGTVARLAAADAVMWLEGSPPPSIPNNTAGRRLSDVDALHRAPFNLTGRGVAVGVWEALEGHVDPRRARNRFRVLTTHEDLTGRVTVAAGQVAGPSSNHGTHVAGTIAGDGSSNRYAEGMAPDATISSYDNRDDAAEMVRAARSNGVPPPAEISNHSYSQNVGWNDSGDVFVGNRGRFGLYTPETRAFDQVVTAEGLVVVKSASNDRNEGWNGRNPVQWDGASVQIGVNRADPGRDCRQGSLRVDADCIPPVSGAKNILTVGAVTGDSQLMSFSSFGPTNDGRIKPDLVASGFLLSTMSNDTNRDGRDDCRPANRCHRQLFGTSMSAPVVSGALAALMQRVDALGLNLAPASYKALLIQSARDVVSGQASVGPDYASGWGLLDADGAATLLLDPLAPAVREATLRRGGANNGIAFTIDVPRGQAELRVTLVWDDPAAAPAAAASLVNDLDLRIFDPNNRSFRPWVLDPNQPGNAARRGGNDSINNVEQVSVLAPQAGQWTVRVSAGTGNLPQAPQNFSVAWGTRSDLGQGCRQDRDCSPIRAGRGYCADAWHGGIGRCAPPNGFGQPGDYCHHDDHCRSDLSCLCVGDEDGPWCRDWESGNRGLCGFRKAFGGACGENRDCAPILDGRGLCADGARCAPPDKFGRQGDYCHHDNHCGPGLTCTCSGPKNGPWCDRWEAGVNAGVCR